MNRHLHPHIYKSVQYIYIYIYMFINICLYISIHIYIYIYIYMYMYIYIYICTYIDIDIYGERVCVCVRVRLGEPGLCSAPQLVGGFHTPRPSNLRTAGHHHEAGLDTFRLAGSPRTYTLPHPTNHHRTKWCVISPEACTPTPLTL